MSKNNIVERKQFALGFMCGMLALVMMGAASILGDFEKSLAQVMLGQTGMIGDQQTKIRGWIYNEDGTVAIGPSGVVAKYVMRIPVGDKPLSEIYNDLPQWAEVLQDTSLPADYSVDDYYEAMGFGPDM